MTAPRFKRLAPEARATELVEAGLRVLARGGITAFTIDAVCKAAGASRGLIGHHFGGKDGLLAACYSAAYAPLLRDIAGGAHPPPLPDLIEELLSDRQFRAEGLNLWLALWAAVATSPRLQEEHRRHLATYEAALGLVIADHARANDRPPPPPDLAATLIALLDGLWLEGCIAPGLIAPAQMRSAIHALLVPHLGPLSV
jgi:AcrR family transcriptional regulator